MQILPINDSNNKPAFGMNFLPRAQEGIHKTLSLLETDTLELLSKLKTQEDGSYLREFTPNSKNNRVFIAILSPVHEKNINKWVPIEKIHELFRKYVLVESTRADVAKRKTLIRNILNLC